MDHFGLLAEITALFQSQRSQIRAFRASEATGIGKRTLRLIACGMRTATQLA
jgi:hypothetical protein